MVTRRGGGKVRGKGSNLFRETISVSTDLIDIDFEFDFLYCHCTK